MEGIDVDAGQIVLLLWSESAPSEDLQETVSDLQARVQGTGRVQVEHVDRLGLGKSSTLLKCKRNKYWLSNLFTDLLSLEAVKEIRNFLH